MNRKPNHVPRVNNVREDQTPCEVCGKKTKSHLVELRVGGLGMLHPYKVRLCHWCLDPIIIAAERNPKQRILPGPVL